MLSRKRNNIGLIMDGKRKGFNADYDESATHINQNKYEVVLRESGDDE